MLMTVGSVKPHCGGALILGALSLASGPLPAQTAGAGVSYTSSSECPDEQQFRDQVALHVHSQALPLARPIVVDARQLEGHSIALVRFEDENGVLGVREFSAPTCAEAVTAAALVVALAIDSRSQVEKPPAAPAPAPAKHEARTAPPEIDEYPTRSETATNLAFQFGAGVVAHMVITPEPMLGATAFVGLGEQPSWDLRGAILYAASGTVTRDARAAEFTLVAGRLDGCALQLAKSARFSLDPCLAVELGALRSVGLESEQYSSSEETTFWMAGGPLLRGQALVDPLRLEAYAGPWFPIAGRQSFVFHSREGDLTFHDVPPVGLLAGLNVSLAID
jgi:hypothetical protein